VFKNYYFQLFEDSLWLEKYDIVLSYVGVDTSVKEPYLYRIHIQCLDTLVLVGSCQILLSVYPKIYNSRWTRDGPETMKLE